MRLRETQGSWQRRQSADLPPSIIGFLEEGHAQRFDPVGDRVPRAPESSSPWYVPNQWLVSVTRQLRTAKLWKAFNEEVIHTQADNAARLCGRMTHLADRIRFTEGCGVESPEPKAPRTEAGCAARMADALWWRRQFRKVWTRSAECGLRRLGMIRRGRQCYASDSAVFFRKSMQRRMEQFLRTHQLLSEHGELLELHSVATRSLSNPALRRGEWMTRLNGLTKLSEQHGHVWDAFTLTCPSAFHPQLHAGGDNPRYNGTTVREAQAWLCRMWARVRANLNKKGVFYYGFRTAEPHHDATPHWHMLIAADVRSLDTFRDYVSRAWLSEYGDEPGAAERRVNVIRLDPDKGSAVAYAAKYVSKNIDAYGGIESAEDLETGTPIHANTLRVNVWSRTHGIRQFQQIGGPAISLWRELRRIRTATDIPDADIAACWKPADAGQYARFVQCVGGIRLGRRTNIRLEKVDQHRKNRYGEDKGPCVVGVRYASSVQITRTTEWRVIPCGHTLPPWAFSSWGDSSAIPSATEPKMITTCPIPARRDPCRRVSLAIVRDSVVRVAAGVLEWMATFTRVRPETQAEADMWEKLMLRSGSRSSLGPVAITVTSPAGGTVKSGAAPLEKDTKSPPDPG